MIKREHVRDDMMFINFAKSLRDVEISALAEIEGELPQKLNKIMLDFRFELRSKESSCQIEAGDTLWDIAVEYGPENSDVRKIVREICDLNEITADGLYVGQRIIVPVYK